MGRPVSDLSTWEAEAGGWVEGWGGVAANVKTAQAAKEDLAPPNKTRTKWTDGLQHGWPCEKVVEKGL